MTIAKPNRFAAGVMTICTPVDTTPLYALTRRASVRCDTISDIPLDIFSISRQISHEQPGSNERRPAGGVSRVHGDLVSRSQGHGSEEVRHVDLDPTRNSAAHLAGPRAIKT